MATSPVGNIEIIEKLAPIYVVNVAGVPSDEVFAAYLKRLTEVTRTTSHRVLVYDATFAGSIRASQRKAQADWIRENELVTRHSTLGCAFVLPNPVIRGVLTAILWVQPIASPHALVAALPDALAWAREKLDEHAQRSPEAKTKWVERPTE